jgi:hypothetical protein
VPPRTTRLQRGARASEAGLQIVDATDEERGALAEAGYALPSHVASV